MNEYFSSFIDQLKEIDPSMPTSEKLRLLMKCVKEWASRNHDNNNLPEEYRAIAKALLDSSIGSPNPFTYAVIMLGMSEGGWWTLTEKQRQAIRDYIFHRNSFNTVANAHGIAYPTVRETYLRGFENLRINAIKNYPLFKDILTSQPSGGKSKTTHQYRDEKRENLAKVRETEAYIKRQFIPGPGRGHRKEENW